jgi:hypothetical protein
LITAMTIFIVDLLAIPRRITCHAVAT